MYAQASQYLLFLFFFRLLSFCEAWYLWSSHSLFSKNMCRTFSLHKEADFLKLYFVPVNHKLLSCHLPGHPPSP